MKAGNNSSETDNQGISDDLCNWSKPKNSKSRSRRSSADEVPNAKLRNRFSVLVVDQQSTGFLNHMDKKVKPVARKTKVRKARCNYLEVVMGLIGPMLQEHLVTEYEITSIFKPNAPLANIIVDLRRLGNDLTKRDHIIIVGGPRNSLDRNYHYSFQKYINFIAERSNNTNVRSEILF